MPTLLLAEHRDGRLDPQTAQALTAALALGGAVDLLMTDPRAAAAGSRFAGVTKVLLAETPPLAEPLADLIVSLAPAYDAVVAPAR